MVPETKIEHLITEEEAAARLGLLRQTLQRWRQKRLGHLPYVLIAKSVRYKPSDIRDYIAQHRRPAAE